MKNLIALALFITTSACFLQNKDISKLNLDGYWALSSSDYNYHEAIQLSGCLDPEAMALYEPFALGSHFFIKEDSISFFRYPYEYYGTCKFRIIKDSLFTTNHFAKAHSFSIQLHGNDTLRLYFKENIVSSCQIRAEAEYKRFFPDAEIIKKLIRDSLAFESLVGKWWYVRKEISYEDGSEPTILRLPKGMPDSLFISNEIIKKDVRHPFIKLTLDHRTVKLMFRDPSENSFTLSANYVEQGKHGRIDTIRYNVVYNAFK